MPKKRQQKGGNADVEDIHLWAQDQAPSNSYKIQLGYLEIPKAITFDERWLDTPYRFKSFSDADMEADKIFNGYLYRIVSSNDQPSWDAPSYLHQNMKTLKENRWYDIVGVEPTDKNYQMYSPMGVPPKLNPEREYVLNELSKLKPPISMYEHASKSVPMNGSTVPKPRGTSRSKKSDENKHE